MNRLATSLAGVLLRLIASFGALFLLCAHSSQAEEVRLQWSDNSFNEDGFIIERSQDGEVYEQIGFVGENVTSYVDEAVSYGQSYAYRVYAYNEFGASGYTNVESRTVGAPFVDGLSDALLPRNQQLLTLPFTIGDDFTPAEDLNVVVANSDEQLMPLQNIAIDGIGAERSLVLLRTGDVGGEVTITLEVSDGTLAQKEEIKIRIEGLPTFFRRPQGRIISAGGEATLSVGVSGLGLGYQWYEGERGDTSLPVWWASGPSLAIIGLEETTRYWSRIYFQDSSNAEQISYIDSDSVEVVAVTPEMATARLVNASVNHRLRPGSDSLIAGFVLGGVGADRILLRGAGPTLGGYGVSYALEDPTLALFEGQELLASNDDWEQSHDIDALTEAFSIVGAFPFASGGKDAAILQYLSPGVYAMQVDSGSESGGVTLAEVYHVDTSAGLASGLEFKNISMRGHVDSTGPGIIAGFVLNGGEYARLLIRAVGPELGNYGVQDALQNPRLILFRDGERLLENDDWQDQASGIIENAFSQVGAFPLDVGSASSVMLRWLPAGVYTVKAHGSEGDSGDVLVEVYLVK